MSAKITIEIDGSRFDTLDAFYEEFYSKFPFRESWWGNNIAALEDLMSEFITPETAIQIIWHNSSISRKRLSYEETVNQLEKRLAKAHSTNKAIVQQDIEQAKNRKGPTVFDWLTEILAVPNTELLLK